MRQIDETPALGIYQKAYQLYHIRLLTILVLIPLYILTTRWGDFKMPVLPFYFVIFVEVFINRPYKFLYTNTQQGANALIASVMIDFLAETVALHLVGSVDIFVYSSCYFISIVYCALNLPISATFKLATLASTLYASLIIFGHVGLIPKTVSVGIDLDMSQEIAILVRHIAFFYLIAFLVRYLEKALVKNEEKLSELFWDLKTANEKMRYSYQLQKEYFARMSHEIRSPVNSILGFSQVLLETAQQTLTEKQKDFLARIEKSAIYLRDLINDILDLSKIEAKKVRLVLQQADLVKIVEPVFDIFHQDTNQKKILFAFTKKPSHPLLITCDILKIRQILHNLLSNAIKFTPSGGHIQLSLSEKEQGAEIVVEDSGPGIAPEFHESIFRPYEQFGHTSMPTVKGTGLGLAITKHFVEMHGGKIWVESEVGKGSKFFVQLPAKPPECSSEERSAQEKQNLYL